jgi:hypothetical protein
MVAIQKPVTTACNQTTACGPKDVTAPPTPSITFAIASSGLGGKNAVFVPSAPPRAAAAPRDPGYIEVANWEPGSSLQLLNRSANPTASWDNPADIITLAPTGRNVKGRTASLWIPEAQMEKLSLASGHDFELRQIDLDGNASGAVKGRLQGEGYGERGFIREGKTNTPGARLGLLDGENVRKNLMLKYQRDNTAPVVKYFERALTLDADSKGQVNLSGSGLLERGARVSVLNGRTGATLAANVDDDRGLKLPLGKDVKDGDTLYVTVTDAVGNAAPDFELRYAAACKGGRGSTLGILAARLNPSIG